MSDTLGPPKIMTKDETALMLRCDIRTLDRLRATGGGPRSFKIGKNRMYRLSDVERWVENRVRLEK